MTRRVRHSPGGRLTAVVGLLAVLAIGAAGFSIGPRLLAQGMDLRQAAGVPLPANDLPAGTVSARVIRGSFANNLAGVDVTFSVDGRDSVVKTDDGGRAQVSGLKPGARVKVSATVDGERLESQETTIAASGIRFMLLASESGAAPAPGTAPAASAAGPVVKGTAEALSIGSESRMVIDFSNDSLNIYYVVQIVNGTGSLLDIGGPVIIELPVEARSATVMEGSTPQATVRGAHVTVLGPFAPGRTDVSIAYQLLADSGTARIDQKWPLKSQPFSIFALRTGDLDINSPQIQGKQQSVQQGQPLVMGLTPALKSGELFVVDITGLPHHPSWPRNLALGLAGAISALGLWAAFVPSRRRTA